MRSCHFLLSPLLLTPSSWLSRGYNNPHVSWREGELKHSLVDPLYEYLCLQQYSTPMPHHVCRKPRSGVPRNSSTRIPWFLRNGQQVNLLPNALPPKNCIYPLSLSENKAMEDYIEEGLNGSQGFSSWKKRCQSSTMYRLQRFEFHHHPLPISTSTSTYHSWTVTRG